MPLPPLTAILYRGDLLRALGRQPLISQVSTLEYQFSRVLDDDKDSNKDRPNVPTEDLIFQPIGISNNQPKEEDPIVQEKPRFWLPTYTVSHSPEVQANEQTLPAPFEEAEIDVPQGAKGSTLSAPPDLAPWSRLQHFVRNGLGRNRPGNRIHLAKLFRRVARGEPILELPRCFYQTWASEAVLLVDISPEMFPFQRDLAVLRKLIHRERGASGLHEIPVRRVPTLQTLQKMAPAGTPILILSAMGQLSRNQTTIRRWLKLGTALRRRGHLLKALVPCPRQRWDGELSRVWQSAVWDKRARMPRKGGHRALPATDHDSGVEPLLTLLSPSVIVDAGLLREARAILGNHADVGAEYDAWFHHSCWASKHYFGFEPESNHHRLEQLAHAEDDDVIALREVVGRLILSYHQACSQLLLEEARGNVQHVSPGSGEGRSVPNWALRLLQNLRSIAQDPDGEEGSKSGLARHVIELMERLPPGLRASPALSAALACAYHYFQEENITWMKGVNCAAADAERKRLVQPPQEASQVNLFLRKHLLFQVPHAAASLGESFLGTIDYLRPNCGLSLSNGADQNVANMAHFKLDVEGNEALTLNTDLCGFHLQSVECPTWAKTLARDRFGLYADLEIKGVRLRMRWIPPGRFTMGDEDDVPAHEVTISMGYWMAVSLTTQKLWTTVKGENPSANQKSPQHPVEKVSWEDCVAFCQELEALVPELSFTLPTEAQWEYACRAGTTSRFNNGSDDEEKLKELAWFGDCGSTHEVGQKQGNQWGLYDMHGNLWEWCLDARREYAREPATHPVGPLEEGAPRALRGGSWAYYAGCCRSAYRSGLAPGPRHDDFGFRLVAGQPQQVIRGAVRPEAQEQAEGQRGGAAGHALLKPRWADHVAEDGYGIRAEFELNGVGFVFRKIEAGSFLMGSPEDEKGRRAERESPQHEVRISRGFWAAATPVTQAQWEVVMGEGNNPSSFKGEKHPVEQVSWEDCQEYLSALREKVPGLPVELPTEAQWEFACRGGTKTAFSDGSDCTVESGAPDPALEKLGWYDQNSGNGTHAVGELAANPRGLYDVHGNVLEWCRDYLGSYAKLARESAREALVDPVGSLEEGAPRALRGGGWAYNARVCRSASRNGDAPGGRSRYFGFRLVAGEELEAEQGAEPKNKKPEQERAPAIAPVGLWQKNVHVPWPWDKKPRIEGPSWATKVSEDGYGILAELDLDGVSFVFRHIKPGTFLMGSPEDENGRHDGEGPQHAVKISRGFWIGATPVTQVQWLKVLPGDNPSKFKGENHPVEKVSWTIVRGISKL